ncbi:hypothetical protein CORC01_06155 [Colletotrichum orchidophilum]|uniref:Ribosome assembly protein 3 n=1 Tax=Colletotrichum orchidophilum TaxID=1209926 RepID=A0A1G4BAV9_9PEZI|nr:uncharacterized protein CORC01_06155 [Colletotrichum orchidophilum]OHE98534.1 hypothetical protein CORC01_06155 [Colletotrichum orchidophilum]
MAATTRQEFTAFYLQRTTQEFAEDLDKVRAADDFKADSVPFLVHALQQGTELYSARDQERVVRPAAAKMAAADEDVDMVEPTAVANDEEEQNADAVAIGKKEKTDKKERKEKCKKKKKTTSG